MTGTTAIRNLIREVNGSIPQLSKPCTRWNDYDGKISRGTSTKRFGGIMDNIQNPYLK